jgi:O-antigen ligase
LSPWLFVAFFWTVAVVAYATGLSEPIAAGAVTLFFVVVATINPVNGLFFILLALPFFLGEYGWPYMWLIELFAVATLLSWGVHTLLARRPASAPGGRLLALFLLAAAMSVPVDARQLPYEIWTASWREVLGWWVVGHTGPITYYFRILFNLVTAAGLYALAATSVARYGIGPWVAQLRAMVGMAGLVGIAGIVMWGAPLRDADDIWRYLSASLVGEFGGSITAFAFALHFFQQYLILTFPLVVALCFLDRRRPKWLVMEGTAGAVILYCVFQGSLRTSTALVFLTLAAAVVLLLVRFLRRRGVVALTLRFGVWTAVALLVGAYLLTYTSAFERLAYDFGSTRPGLWTDIGDYVDDPMYFLGHNITEPRFMLWHTAVKMWADSPVLGVGLGRFSPLFISYFGPERFSFGLVGYASGATSHSLYFEMLANQGIVGLSLFLLFVVAVVVAGIRSIGRGDEAVSAVTLAGLGIAALWFLMGLTHYIPLCRSVELYFYVTLGLVGGIAHGLRPFGRLSNGTAAIMAALILVAGAFQLVRAVERPLSPTFAPGFYHWERQPDGSVMRWMGRRGVYVAPVADGAVTLRVAAPLPGLDRRPQQVTVTVAGERGEATLHDDRPHTITVPVDLPDGTSLPVKMETAWVFNPKEAGVNENDDRDLGVMILYEEEGER